MSKEVACVIPAAGWGSVCPDRSAPKMLALIDKKPMLFRVIETVRAAGIDSDIVVVVGANDFGSQIVNALVHKNYERVTFMFQTERTGAADAVRLALPKTGRAKHILVTFGDMPLWRPQTIRDLVAHHLLEQPVAVSMVTLPYQPSHPTARYGRVARDASGAILAAFEPSDLGNRELSGVASVNPSLYVFERRWLATSIPLIEPTDKGDGFSPEIHLPKLLPIAHDTLAGIAEMPLLDANEALGVNTPEELAEVNRVFTERGER